MFTSIDELLTSNNTVIQNTATITTELINNLKSGTITREEYDDLSADLLNVKRIDTLATSIEDKAQLNDAFNFLTTLIGSVK
jgi:hypothetical protein